MSRLLAACALSALVLLAPATARASESYGELTRFGEGGLGEGKLNDEENEQVEGTLRTHLIGVDPTDNSVYVLDQPTEAKQKHKEPTPKQEKECKEAEPEIPPSECGGFSGPITRQFRIQKFSPESGKVTASVLFEEVTPEGADQSPLNTDIEGIAVNPANKHIYVLSVGVRKRGIGIDERGPLGNEPVASTLFAFEETKEGKLVPAGKTAGSPVLAGPGETELAAQSKTPGRALLQPTGITVDPENGDIVVLAHEDPTGGKEDVPVNEEGTVSPDHFVAQRVLPSGALASGPSARWSDPTNFFHSGISDGLPNSPVIVGPASSEQFDVQYEGRIAQIPATFGSSAAAEYVYSLPKLSGATSGGVKYLARGGALSATPSSEGNILYAPTEIENEQPKGGGFAWAGVLRISPPSPTASLLGWAGGQNLVAERGAGEPNYECVLEPAGGGPVTPVAAGKEGKVFVLALGFIEKSMLENREETTYGGSAFPAIVELGPGGRGCPPAKADQLSGEISGVPVGEREIGESEAVTFSSYVNQADALKVEWNFGDGTTKTVTEGFKCPSSAQYRELVRQCPAIEHAFSKSGKLTVTETVYTDDLSTPTVTLQTTVNVAGSGGGKEEEGGGGKEEGGGGKEEGGGGSGTLKAVLLAPIEAAPGEPRIFDGSPSSHPGTTITAYHWSFGDGSAETTTVPVTSHSYATPGEYMPSLSVTDALGNTSAPSRAPSPVRVLYPTSSGGGPTANIASGHPPVPSGNVGGFTNSQAPVPIVTLAEAAAVVDSRGRLTLKLRCPTGETSCAGQLSLRAVIATGTRKGKKRKSAPSTFASGNFALPGGATRSVVLHVSSKARAALARRRRLVAQLTIFAHDPVGASHTTRLPVLVTAASQRRHR